MAAAPPPKPRYAGWLRLLQMAGTLTLAVVLARSVDWRHAGDLLRNLRWEFMGLAALLMLATHLTNVARWRFLLWPGQVPYLTLLGYYGAGLFSNNFLPTGMGGDGIRAALAGRHVPAGRAVLSVALDRSLGLAALIACILPGLWLGLPPALPILPTAAGEVGWPLLAALGGLLAGLAAATVVWRRTPRLRARAAWLYARWFALPDDAGLAPWQYWASRLGVGLLFSCASAALMIIGNVAILAAVGLEPSPAAALWAVVLSSLSLLAPIAVNGVGVMEGVYVVVLAGYGVGGAAALSVALLARLFIILYSLIGGLLSLRPGVAKPRRGETPPAGPRA